MNQNLTDLTIILDRSGSMESIRTDMEGGLSKLIADQRSHPGHLNVSLVRFDDIVEQVFTALPGNQVRTIKIHPRGCTALLDAVALTIDQTGDRLEAMPESDRPGTVIFVIVTDGFENASKRFSWLDVQHRIQHQNHTYLWQFIFLGTNIDAIATATQMGISHGDAMTFANDSTGTLNAVASASAGIRRKREQFARAGNQQDMQSVPAFTNADRDFQQR